jgi:uncharacterized SAM-binding protein YcdF (DUF218 family)
VTDAVQFIFSAGGVVSCALAFALWLSAHPRSRVPRFTFVLVAVLYFCAALYGVGYALERPLVRGYHPFSAADVPSGRTAIVLLGSDSYTARAWDGSLYTVVSLVGAERAREATRVYRSIGAEWVITSGGLVHPDGPNIATGIANRQALIALGLPEARIITLSEARTTYEEAATIAPLLQRLGAERVVLVTSDSHMRRAVGTFRAAGVSVIPAIARDTFLDFAWPRWWLPSDAGLWHTGAVAHEYLGIVGYFAQGRFKF